MRDQTLNQKKNLEIAADRQVYETMPREYVGEGVEQNRKV